MSTPSGERDIINNAIKQDLFILRQNKHGCEDKIDKIDKALINLTSLLTTPTVYSKAKPTEPEPEKQGTIKPNDPRTESKPEPKPVSSETPLVETLIIR